MTLIIQSICLTYEAEVRRNGVAAMGKNVLELMKNFYIQNRETHIISTMMNKEKSLATYINKLQ